MTCIHTAKILSCINCWDTIYSALLLEQRWIQSALNESTLIPTGCSWATLPGELPSTPAGLSPVCPYCPCLSPSDAAAWVNVGMQLGWDLGWWQMQIGGRIGAALINRTVLWHKIIVCLEWVIFWKQRGKGSCCFVMNMATRTAFQRAHLPVGQSWGFLPFWTAAGGQHEHFYIPRVKPSSC